MHRHSRTDAPSERLAGLAHVAHASSLTSLTHRARLVLLALTLLGGAAVARAQGFVDAPRDVPYAGTIEIELDVADPAHGIARVRERVPVPGGPQTFFFPRFLPGTHGPYGAVHRFAGLEIKTSDGARVDWRRDEGDAFAFHVDVPASARRIEIAFQYLLRSRATSSDEGIGTRRFMNLPWSQLVFYPAGHHVRGITMQASLVLPPQWHYATSLTGQRHGDRVRFDPVSLETLVDSPIFAGTHMKSHRLDPADHPRPIALHHFAASQPELDAVTDAQIDAHRRLVQQADRLFGARHFDRYEFLLATIADVGFDGLEHHQSSENVVHENYFKDWDKSIGARELLPHEFAHSWNGKFRRPADLLAPNFNVPTRNSLLWLYEGQTEYWGWILAVRSGLTQPAQWRESVASTIAHLQVAPGRRWRDLQDTTTQGINRGRTFDTVWGSWQRGEDYYHEAALVWLEADMRIRDLTKSERSLDDFARDFFGVHDGRIEPLAYDFDALVAALERVAAHDWRAFLLERLRTRGTAHLTAGIEAAGWRLAFGHEPGALEARAAAWRGHDFAHSLGMHIDAKRATIRDVLWEGPAFAAGVPLGGEIVAVNGRVFDADRLREALTDNQAGKGAVVMIVKDGDRVDTYRLDPRTGPRHPKLERIDGRDERLDAVLLKAR